MAVGAAPSSDPPFVIRDCTLITLATGVRAYTLGELMAGVRTVPADSIYYHFWGTLLQGSFEEREYNNDLANWVRHSLHFHPLAEQLAVLDPSDYADLEALRAELFDLMDASLYGSERLTWVRSADPFEFLRHQIVVFDTGRRIETVADMARAIPNLSESSVFYHFVEARRRQPDARDDFRAWLDDVPGDHDALCQQLASIDPYFGHLHEVRTAIAEAFAAQAEVPVP